MFSNARCIRRQVGTVDHLHGFGVDVKAIVDFGRLFALGVKPVALSLGHLDFMRDEEGTVHATTRLSEDDLKEVPKHVD